MASRKKRCAQKCIAALERVKGRVIMSFEKNLEIAKEKARKVKLFGHDIHGVLTLNNFYCDIEGKKRTGFWHMDGFGDLSLIANGISIAFLDTTSIGTEGFHRADELKLSKYYHRVANETEKLSKIDELERDLGITDENFGYIGCEVTDLVVMKRAGFAVATADAHDDVKALADYITTAPGGRGTLREICEFILSSMGKWETWVESVTKKGYK